jgi:hypothetical protein
MDTPGEDLLIVEDALAVLTRPTGHGIYDFPFDRLLACRRPYEPPPGVRAVARVGAVPDYRAYFARWAERGVQLVHTPEEQLRATELPAWYPLLHDLTPSSVWFSGAPDVEVVERALGWPVFMKGQRQTSHHKKSLSIIPDRDAFVRAVDAYARDPILQWQGIVCRKLLPLRRVEEVSLDRVPTSFEFRTFWWKSELVGFGRYWWEGTDYAASTSERHDAVAIAQEAASRIGVTFLVVDVAQDVSGRWHVIECNDGQESGYAGVSPLGLWQATVQAERRRSTP